MNKECDRRMDFSDGSEVMKCHLSLDHENNHVGYHLEKVKYRWTDKKWAKGEDTMMSGPDHRRSEYMERTGFILAEDDDPGMWGSGTESCYGGCNKAGAYYRYRDHYFCNSMCACCYYAAAE